METERFRVPVRTFDGVERQHCAAIQKRNGPVVTSALQRPTLVLNRNWQPVGVSTVSRSLVKVWNESARIVDPADFQQYAWDDWALIEPADGEACIQTQWLKLKVPEVIALTNYDRQPTNVVAFSRRNVFKRDNFTCQYCGLPTWKRRTHDRPRSPRAQGGVSSWTQLRSGMRRAAIIARPTERRNELACRCESSRFDPCGILRTLAHGVRLESWSKFVSDAYWNVELED